MVFIVTVTHQETFTLRMHFQAKPLQNVQRRVIISYCALCKHADGIFSQFLIFSGLLQAVAYAENFRGRCQVSSQSCDVTNQL